MQIVRLREPEAAENRAEDSKAVSFPSLPPKDKAAALSVERHGAHRYMRNERQNAILNKERNASAIRVVTRSITLRLCFQGRSVFIKD